MKRLNINQNFNMKFLVLFITILTLQVCSSKPTNGSDSTSKPSKTSVEPGDYPYHAVVRLAYGEKFPECEGALIEKNFVLTSAGCADKFKSDPKSLEIVMGAVSTENLDVQKNIQKRSVLKIFIHPQYNASASSNDQIADMALLKVSTPFRMNDYVNVPSYGGHVNEKEIYKLVSYGYSEELKSALVQVATKTECETDFSRRDFTKDFFCVKYANYGYYVYGDYYAGASLAHNSDSTHHIYGISSSTSGGIITPISSYADWIESITGQPSRTTPLTTPSPTSTYASSTSE